MDTTQSRRWVWIASIWFGFGLFDATQTVLVMRSEGMHHAWTKLFVTLLLAWLPWALATPLVVSVHSVVSTDFAEFGARFGTTL